MGDFSLDMIGDLSTDLLIGGKAVPASDGGRFDVLDPATGQVLATVADGTVEDALGGRRRRGRCRCGLGGDVAAGALPRSCAARSS